jgi:archaellum component FlaG (FlaF/FlaG flagellin family)
MDGAIPVFKVSGTHALMVFLIVTVLFGAAHLAALSYPDSKLSKAWVLLGF